MRQIEAGAIDRQLLRWLFPNGVDDQTHIPVESIIEELSDDNLSSLMAWFSYVRDELEVEMETRIMGDTHA